MGARGDIALLEPREGTRAAELVESLRDDPRLRLQRCASGAELGDWLARQAPGAASVVVVAPDAEHPEPLVQQLLEAHPELRVVMLTAPTDRRTLGERFQHRPVRARRLELMPLGAEAVIEEIVEMTEGWHERQRHHAALHHSAARLDQLAPQSLDLTVGPVLRSMLESLPVGVLIATADGHLVEFNALAAHLLGRAVDVGRRPAHVAELLPSWSANGIPATGHDEVLTLTRDRQVRHLRVRTSALAERGEARGLVVALTDVTEQEEARQLLRATAEELSDRVQQGREELSQVRRERDATKNFIATLAHDLRSPLTVASLNAQLVQRRLQGGSEAPLLETVRRSLERAEGMLADLLDLTRHDVGAGLPVHRRPVRLDQLVRDAVRDLEVVHDRRFELREPVPEVRGVWDEAGLRRILDNLGNNAAKYGDPERAISVWLQDAADQVSIHVRNYGPTLAPETQKALFEPFYRAYAPRTRSVPGWGVGLAFVRAMTEAHGGTVSVSSSDEKGTVFSIGLPKQPPAEAQAEQP